MRARGWRRPPLRVEIEKRIPVAAGLGGGSADAAAVLRLAGGELDGLDGLAAALGADVPSQLDPAFALVGGAGESWSSRCRVPGEFAAVLIPDEAGLPAAEVYAEADRARDRAPPRTSSASWRTGCGPRPAAARRRSPTRSCSSTTSRQAAISLRPEIAEALSALDEAGAVRSLVTGSGPTAVGLFDDLAAADRAAEALAASLRRRDRLGAAPARIIVA